MGRQTGFRILEFGFSLPAPLNSEASDLSLMIRKTTQNSELKNQISPARYSV